MPIPQTILDLIQRFEDNLPAYRSAQYNEAQVREEFITPFFAALGWDVYNRESASERFKPVVHEAALKMGGATKAPDYAFRIGGQRVFFVEAKKPAVAIKDDPAPAYQLRRYAWSAKLPLSILTDFEEFAVYDCRDKPSQDDKAATGRIFYCTYREYPEQWEHLVGIFSPEAITKGAFDRYAETARGKRGTAEVDAAFLAEIEGWRDVLARNIALRNPGLSARDLNYAVQQTIDRIVFLRIAEDRGIEPYQRLLDAAQGAGIYPRLCELFRQADNRYNSGLFHFQKEPDREETPDTFTLGLALDDKVLKGILQSLYYPASPYQFDMLPADILGQVYEQFLGRVIRLTPAGHAKVEEKPEVKKAGGVYYTPTYIVDYIVEHTVGPLLAGKTPAQVKGSARVAPLRLLDPACGSGTFLIQAYQYLLDWYLEQYMAEGVDAHIRAGRLALPLSPPAGGTKGGEWRLTAEERKAILLRHLYGVDIDAQAVEVTKLSLLLKVLEGETEGTLGAQLAMSLAGQDRVLPDLSRNIRCGNSLIGEDYYTAQQLSFGLVDDEMQYRINAFDWEQGFHTAMMAGGFDAVIGNPPYFNIDDTWGKGDARQRYIKRAYQHVYNDKTDILFYFLAKAVEVSKGEVGFIVSRAFLEAYKADKLRGWLSGNTSIRQIVDFQNYYVFKGVGITTAIIFLTKNKTKAQANIYRLETDNFTPSMLSFDDPNVFEQIMAGQSSFGSDSWTFADADIEKLLQKIDTLGKNLGDILIIGQGMQTGRNNVFGKLLSESTVQSWGLESGLYYTRARNSDIKRYCIEDSKEILLYVEDVREFAALPNNVQDHLKSHQSELKKRAAYQRGNCDWWRYTWPLHKEYMERHKIYCPYMATKNRFALDKERKYLGLTDTTVLFDNNQPEDLRYLLGLLNSRVLNFRFQYIGKLKSGNIREYFWNGVSKLPIRTIDFTDPTDVARHDRMVALVTRMLDLHRQLPAAKTPQSTRLLQQQIDLTDKAIDALVYDLYGLTAEEIAIVEGDER